MVSLRFCGPKLSICCSILSVWGIIMLFLLGIFLWSHSVAFAEDLPLEEFVGTPDFDIQMSRIYTQASYNCLIAACLYIVSLGVSVWQYFLNRRASSTTWTFKWFFGMFLSNRIMYLIFWLIWYSNFCNRIQSQDPSAMSVV